MNNENLAIPNFLLRYGIRKLGLTHESLGVLLILAGYEGDTLYENFIKEASTGGPLDERLTPFEIQRIIQDFEKQEILKVIKYKTHYSIKWLPKAFGAVQ
jgi:hypothetical protein